MGTSDNVPEPSGPPEPVLESGPGGSPGGAGPSPGGPLKRLGATGLVIAAAGGAVLLVAASVFVTPTMGATRSARLTWQQRGAEIEQAVAEAEGLSPADAGPAGSARGAQ